ncbi:MAG: hypothetical protein AAF542_19425 [Pseudomonadota bacterium]
MSRTFGWMLTNHPEKELSFDEETRFGASACLIRPFMFSGDGESIEENEHGYEISASQAHTELGKLLFPWDWEFQSWLIFEYADDSWVQTAIAEVYSSSGVESFRADPSDDERVKSEIRQAIHTEVLAKTGIDPLDQSTEYAFSVHADYAIPVSSKSLVHAIAPLSQLVAPIANGALKMGHIMVTVPPEFDEADAATITRVALPTFTTEDKTFKPSSIEWLSEEDKLVRAEYGLVDENTKFEMWSEVHAYEMESESAGPQEESSDPDVIALRNMAMESLVGELSPLILASDAIDEIKRKREEGSNNNTIGTPDREWATTLMNQVGKGWLLDEDSVDDADDNYWEQYVNHLFHSFLTESQLNSIFAGFRDDERSLETVLPPRKWEANELQRLIPVGQLSRPLLEEKRFFETVRNLLHNPGGISDLDEWQFAVSRLRSEEGRSKVTKSWLRHLISRWKSRVSSETTKASYCDELDRATQNFAGEQVSTSMMTAACGYALHGDVESYIESELTQVSEREYPGPYAIWAKEILDKLGVSVDRDDETDQSAAWLQPVVDRFIARVREQAEKRPLARDDGILIGVEDKSLSGESDQDIDLRGYAVGIRGYYGEFADDLHIEACWVTNAAVTYKRSDEERPIVVNDEGKPILATATVGSVLANGRRLVEVPYDGEPVCAAKGLAEKSDDELLHAEWLDFEPDPELDERDSDKAQDYDGTDAFDYAWYASGAEYPDPPVPLAYGATYEGIATKITNAGMIQDVELRVNAVEGATELKTLEETFGIERLWRDGNTAHSGRFFCNEAIGAPSVQIASGSTEMTLNKCYRFSEDTKATTFARTRIGLEQAARREASRENDSDFRIRAELGLTELTTNPKVALMVRSDMKPATFIEDSPSHYKMTLEPPIASEVVVERWMNSEYELARINQASMISDRWLRKQIEEGDFDKDDIATLTSAIRGFYKETEKSNTPIENIKLRFHPGVIGYGVGVKWRGTEHGDDEDQVAIPINRYLAKEGELSPALRDKTRIGIRIEAAQTDDHGWKIETPDDGEFDVIIKVGRGEFVEVSTYSLVEERLFEDHEDGSIARLSEIVLNGRKASFDLDLVDGDNKITVSTVGFGGQRYWFEVAPEAQTGLEGFTDSVLKLDTPASPMAPTLLRLETASGAELQADWVKGVTIQRHQWHWIGTPVEFTAKGDLPTNLVNLSGVGSFRESKQHGLLESTESGSWNIISGQTLAMYSRSKTAPSDYIVYTCRPQVRFKEWLTKGGANSPLKIEGLTAAVGTLIPGQVPTKRLEPPIARWVAPLTEGYEEQKGHSNVLPTRGKNGNMLVFDESIMRTDERAQFGGLAEVIEVDVVEVRPYPVDIPINEDGEVATSNVAKNESGVVPAFHRAPALTEDGVKKIQEYGVTTSSPFGLTYDVGDNPKIVQSAITVFPKGADGKWFMAKLRTRRSLLPELLLDYPSGSDSRLEKTLKTRSEGDDKIIEDTFIDFDRNSIPTRIEIRLANPEKEIEIAVPDMRGLPTVAVPEDNTLATFRLRITWRKDRFGTASPPHWRPSVDVQVRQERGGNLLNKWEVYKTLSPYDGDYDEDTWPAKQQISSTKMVIKIGADNEDYPWPRIGSLHVSDQSDPFWVTFVGMFGQPSLGRADQYRIEEAESEIEGTVKITSDSHLIPKARNVEDSFRSQDDDPLFQVLNVYRPTTSILHAESSESSGRLIGSYVPTNTPGQFAPVGDEAAKIDSECFAYLLTFQRVTAIRESEKGKLQEASVSWEELQKQIFPRVTRERGMNQLESLVRPVPQYLGPIRIKGAV